MVSSSGTPLWEPGVLVSGAQLTAGQSISSPLDAYYLVMQGDGNLVEYNSSGTAVWASGTYPNGSVAVMQASGNFVVLNSSGATLWASGTAGNPGAYLSLSNSGQLSVDETDGAILWRAPT